MKSEKITWNGKYVSFRPGKLYVCMKFNCKNPDALLLKFDPNLRVRAVYKPELYEIFVEPILTLKIASAMMESREFRFVELEREGYF